MPKHDPTEKTKVDMLEVGVQLFRESGWGSVRIEDVVKKLGVTRGAFYHYFKNREDFVYATLMQLLIENNPYVEAMQLEGLTALEKIRYAYKKGVQIPFDAMLTNDDLLKNINDSVAFKCYVLFSMEVVSTYFEELIIEGNKDGSISAKYPKHTAHAALLLYNEWLIINIIKMSPEEFAERVAFLQFFGEQMGVPIIDDELKELLVQNYEAHRGNEI